jgi:hypothetical protein
MGEERVGKGGEGTYVETGYGGGRCIVVFRHELQAYVEELAAWEEGGVSTGTGYFED